MRSEATEKYRFVYDLKRAQWLSKNGVFYITKAYHYKTKNLFYIFEQSKQLDLLWGQYDGE